MVVRAMRKIEMEGKKTKAAVSELGGKHREAREKIVFRKSVSGL